MPRPESHSTLKPTYLLEFANQPMKNTDKSTDKRKTVPVSMPWTWKIVVETICLPRNCTLLRSQVVHSLHTLTSHRSPVAHMLGRLMSVVSDRIIKQSFSHTFLPYRYSTWQCHAIKGDHGRLYRLVQVSNRGSDTSASMEFRIY